MIKTPVSCELIVNQGKLTIVDTDILDADGKLIAIGGPLSNEIVKRINLHDELVDKLKDVVLFVITSSKQQLEIMKLLDKCKDTPRS
jgi:ABC-type phosphate transport system auxiliary subunit